MDKLIKPLQDKYDKIFKYIKGHDFQAIHVFLFLFIVTISPIIILDWSGFVRTLYILLLLSPLYVLPGMALALWHLWIEYIQLQFLADPKQEPVLFEIKIPKTVTKSPKAMEVFLEGLLISQGETTGFDKYWKGRMRPVWSFEIAGIEGEVKMYMWMWRRFKEHVEAQLYAQFPEVELVEVEDYSRKIEYDPKKHFAWGCRYRLTNKEAYPIKTYFDYGLHEHPDKWEVKVDPMINILEKFAVPQKGEQMWMQIVFQKSDRKVNKEAEEEIAKIYEKRAPKYKTIGADEETEGFPILRPAEKELIEAIQRTSTKPSFDVIIRALYIAEKEHMNTLRIQSIVKMFLNYNGFNSFGIDGRAPGGDYPWERYTLPNWPKVLKEFIAAYRLRSGFAPPYHRPSITLTTEELATIFHFPSEESAVPGMEKSQAKSVAPPTNLPT